MLELIITQLYIIAGLTTAFVLYKIYRAYKYYRFHSPRRPLKNSATPSVSVCVPARNENHSMAQCLESVLASNYQKLEIIVLDDQSTDKTSFLIKAFAHAGVRFVASDNLPDQWLGKNFALETLSKEASGKYILFMDVDTRLAPNTIEKAVEYMQEHQKSMLSIIPQRDDSRASTWFGTLRYFWEIILDSHRSPASSSAAWLIDRNLLLNELGGFAKYKDEVQPEMYLARVLQAQDNYAVVISDKELGVTYQKKLLSQIETGRRLLLPRFGNSLAHAMIGIGLLSSVIIPQIVGLVAVLQGQFTLFYVGLLLLSISAVAFLLYCGLIWRKHIFMSIVAMFYVSWQELFLLISSILGYKLGTITWKGRPVKRPTPKKITSRQAP